MKNLLKNKKSQLLFLIVFFLLSIWLLNCSESHSGEEISPLALIPLESVLGNGKPTLAEFGWRECIPCKTMRPILEQLAKEYEGVMNVVIVELPLRPELADKYGIKVMPVQIIFDSNGNEVARHAGAIDKANIVAQLKIMGIYPK